MSSSQLHQLSVGELEAMAMRMYGPSTDGVRYDPRCSLLESWFALGVIQEVIANSSSVYAIFLASHSLKTLLSRAPIPPHISAESLKTFLSRAIVLRHQEGLELFCIRSLSSCLALIMKHDLLECPSDAAKLTCNIIKTFFERGEELVNWCCAKPAGTKASCEISALVFAHAIEPKTLGLVLLDAFVTTAGAVNVGVSAADHRRAVIAFKDHCLDFVFAAAVSCTSHVYQRVSAGDTFAHANYRASLNLMLSVLAYDSVGVVGVEGAEISEDPPSMIYPASWHPYFVQPSFFKMFWDLYEMSVHQGDGPSSETSLQCLSRLSVTKRSLFQSSAERITWFTCIITGTLHVMKDVVGLSEPKNLNVFCSLLSRLKPNYQLNEFLELPMFESWITALTIFTCNAFTQWRSTHAASSYLLETWNLFVNAQQYAREGKTTHFEAAAPQVIMAFLTSRLEMASVCSQEWSEPSSSRRARPTDFFENPLEDNGDDFRRQCTFAAGVLRFSLPSVLNEVAAMFRTAAKSFSEKVQSLSQVSWPPFHPSNATTAAQYLFAWEAEEQLAWLVHIFAQLLKSPAVTEEAMDANAAVVSSCFDVIQLTVQRNTNPVAIPYIAQLAGLPLPPRHLEVALLQFMMAFRAAYIGDPTSQSAQAIARLQRRLGIPASQDVDMNRKLLEFLMAKIVSNLHAWGMDVAVLDATLLLFRELTAGFSSSRQLLEQDQVKQLLSAESNIRFPFQLSATHYKQQVKYRGTLTSILFLDAITAQQLTAYLASMLTTLDCVRSVGAAATLADPAGRSALISCFAELRGAIGACIGRRNFHMLFEVLFPAYLNTLGDIAEALAKSMGDGTCSSSSASASEWTDDQVEVQLLRLVCELCFNRAQRIQFETHSVFGFHLFFFASRIVQALCRQKVVRIQSTIHAMGCTDSAGVGPILSTYYGGGSGSSKGGGGPVAVASSVGVALGDVDRWVVKGSQLLFQLAHHCLGGAYCNLGVMELYQDSRLYQLTEVVWRLSATFRIDQLIPAPKLCRDYFLVMEQLAALHLHSILRFCSAEEWHQWLLCLESCVRGASVPASALVPSCNAIASVAKCMVEANFLFASSSSGADITTAPEDSVPPILRAFRCVSHVDPNCMRRLLHVLIVAAVTHSAHHWALSQPIVPMLLLDCCMLPEILNQMRAELIGRAGAPRAPAINERFDKLLEAIEEFRTGSTVSISVGVATLVIDRRAKDNFHSVFAQFRTAVKPYL